MICVIGSEGSQGKRFQTILKFLGTPLMRHDVSLSTEEPELAHADGFIIATPTATHAKWIRRLIPYGKPILCEKPVTTNIAEMRDLYEELTRHRTPFSMVYQYRHAVSPAASRGHSYYNYFRHGNDGLVWDCLQIIGHARGDVTLEETSPVWQCEVNGYRLDIGDMDMAYVSEIAEWTRGVRQQSVREILDIHEKVHAYAEGPCKRQ